MIQNVGFDSLNMLHQFLESQAADHRLGPSVAERFDGVMRAMHNRPEFSTRLLLQFDYNTETEIMGWANSATVLWKIVPSEI